MKNIAVIAWGDSSEYEVSLQSAKNICDALSSVEEYRVFLILCKWKNKWIYEANDWASVEVDKNDFSIIIWTEKIFLDYVYITIHWTPWENWEIQWYFDILWIPYSTWWVLNTSIWFDKYFSKTVVQSCGVFTPKWVYIKKWDEFYENKIISDLWLPLFVKPNEWWSSFWISKVKEKSLLKPAINKAFSESDNIIVEEAVNWREFTCGLYKTNWKINVLPITEIITNQEFFDYEAKYKWNSKEITPADIQEDLKNLIEETSIRAYERLNCSWIVRIDYIYDGRKLYFLEVNLTPWMTSASLVPQQIKAGWLSLSGVLKDIIEW